MDVIQTRKKGDILLREGMHSNEAFFVLNGCIRSYYTIDGEEKTTEFYTEMQGLTPHCVLNKQASEYNVACVEDSIITVSNPTLDTQAFEKFPRFESLCRIISEELLAKSQQTLDDFKTSSPEQRYLNLLQNRGDLINRAPQHQLASYLGITPQSLSRLRSRLSEKKK